MTTGYKHKVLPATEAANHFGRMIEDAASGVSRFIITRMGRPRAVVLSFDAYQTLLEELEILHEINDPEVQALLAESEEDFRLGRVWSLDDLDREFGFTDDEISGNG